MPLPLVRKSTTEMPVTLIKALGNGVQETDPSAARLSCAEEDPNCITISGKMVYDGTPSGTMRIDVQKVREGSAPMLVHTLELQATDSIHL